MGVLEDHIATPRPTSLLEKLLQARYWHENKRLTDTYHAEDARIIKETGTLPPERSQVRTYETWISYREGARALLEQGYERQSQYLYRRAIYNYVLKGYFDKAIEIAKEAQDFPLALRIAKDFRRHQKAGEIYTALQEPKKAEQYLKKAKLSPV